MLAQGNQSPVTKGPGISSSPVIGMGRAGTNVEFIPEPDKCLCNRPQCTVVCKNCGFKAFGRIYYKCPKHPEVSSVHGFWHFLNLIDTCRNFIFLIPFLAFASVFFLICAQFLIYWDIAIFARFANEADERSYVSSTDEFSAGLATMSTLQRLLSERILISPDSTVHPRMLGTLRSVPSDFLTAASIATHFFTVFY